MQLFAEKILAYRLGKNPSDFKSFGFHEPNTDEGRQVYTIIGDRIYYFLANINTDNIYRTFSHLQQLMSGNLAPQPTIRQVFIIGESSTVEDRAQVQMAVDNYQFPLAADAITLLPTANTASISETSTTTLPNQVTLLPSASAKSLQIQKSLSYINEDPYWDPRRDDLTLATEGILQDRASAITTWLRQQPQHNNVAHPTHQTELQVQETSVQAISGAPPMMDDYTTWPMHYQPSDTALERQAQTPQQEGWLGRRALAGWANNLLFLLFLLAGIGILWSLIWLMRGGLNQPNDNRTNDQRSQNLVPPPPPSSQSFSPDPQRAGTDQATTIQPNDRLTAQTTPSLTANELTQIPTKSFFVQSSPTYDGAQLRGGPGVNYRIIRGVPNGYQVIDAGRQIGEWREVSFQGQEGWIYRPFLR
jgi:hypothetical protein